ncbi:MAG TPA: glycosyltransferase family 1 protein [Solirubrobacteraceae bacterium]|nr:glycosyltransferase family 1 protein [Solirubrobacteraceae bacterium]
MHIGLNLVYLTPRATGGTETVARELIPELVAAAPEHRFTAFVNRDTIGTPGPWSDLIDAVEVPVHALNRVQWVRGEQQLLPPLAHRAGIDLLHSLANTSPVWGRFRRVVTIHDLIYHVVPESRVGLRSRGMRVLVPLAARRCQRIIVDAAATRADLERLVGIAPSRVDVVPLGFGRPGAGIDPMPEAALRERLGAGERPIVLSASAKLPHKNLRRLIEAVALLPAPRPLLVLPGYPTPHESQLTEHAAQLGVSGDVKMLGWVSDEELEGLYAAAAAFVFPSLYEGFGLPVLEAMARGVPVACSDRGSLAEVSGDAALNFDPESVPAISGAIRTLLQDPAAAERLRELGRARAARYTWRAAAEGTLASYERAVRSAS